MKYTVAIHPDDYTAQGQPTEADASSPRWARSLAAAGCVVRWVDVRAPDILQQLEGCHGFMWRWAHFGGMGRIARRLLPVIERDLKILVYPDQSTCWHYDDKITQSYLLKSLSIPIPQTWVWYDENSARAWADKASYPLVLKLAGGAGSANVKLVQNAEEAHLWIGRLFSCRVANLDEEQFSCLSFPRRVHRAASILATGNPNLLPDNGFELHSGYVLFQEFLPGNQFDTRVTVIGHRAFAFRRFNRPNDFRASGSGKLDVDPKVIDEAFIRLAFTTAERLQSQSCAIDGLYRGRERVVGEISYTYVSSAVRSCPGHWELEGDAASGHLRWVQGQIWPEDAQIADFISRLHTQRVSDTARLAGSALALRG